MFTIRSAALAAAIAAAFPAVAQSNSTSEPTLPEVLVTANGIPTRDSDATYASEVHDRAEIQSSGAATLYDFLAQRTALNVQSNYGNKNTPMIDLRGYGTESGYQNVVIVVDGYRLNNIDLMGQLLGSIPLDSIESIEISKGSGSVAFGDGAMGGVIQIHTRKGYTGVTVSTMVGSRGAQAYGVNAGLSRELFDLTINANRSQQPSLSAADSSGSSDGSDNTNGHVNLTLKPVSGLKLFVGGGQSHIDTRYVSPLPPALFATDPGHAPVATALGQASTYPYTHQIYDSKQWRVGGEYEFAPGFTARYVHDGETKTSDNTSYAYGAYNYAYNYASASDDASLRYASKDFDFNVGAQHFKGDRTNATTLTRKENTALYAQGVYRIERWSLSAGVRREQVKYTYAPAGGNGLDGNYMLNAWDMGANYRFNEQLSGFVNLNQGFQAPDVDRFYSYDFATNAYVFNGLIKPAKVKTVTVGANWDKKSNRLRANVFYSRLHDEIYYDPFLNFGTNTNIDKSHKYGLELNERWQVTDKLALSALYTYTRALIDAGDFNGKELPGVPHHAATVGVNWQPWSDAALNVAHTWRSSAYAVSNFTNDSSLARQGSYNSTNVVLTQRWRTAASTIDGYVAVDNLFNRSNGIWQYATNSTEPVNIYPVDFRRLVRVGVKIGF